MKKGEKGRAENKKEFRQERREKGKNRNALGKIEMVAKTFPFLRLNFSDLSLRLIEI